MPLMKAILALGLVALASAMPLEGPFRYKLGNTVVEGESGLWKTGGESQSETHAKRQSGPTGATCGKDTYTAMDIKAAQDAGCKLQKAGKTVGDNDYPHQYKDLEKFPFTTPSPWYEWPILASHQVYDGGDPSVDRVIFNENCEFTGVITHTGASGDDFKACQVNTGGGNGNGTQHHGHH